jgi:hypothetical protein
MRSNIAAMPVVVKTSANLPRFDLVLCERYPSRFGLRCFNLSFIARNMLCREFRKKHAEQAIASQTTPAMGHQSLG